MFCQYKHLANARASSGCRAVLPECDPAYRRKIDASMPRSWCCQRHHQFGDELRPLSPPRSSCSVLGRGLANQVGDRSDPKSDSKLRMKKALDHHRAPVPAWEHHYWVKDTSNGSHANSMPQNGGICLLGRSATRRVQSAKNEPDRSEAAPCHQWVDNSGREIIF